MKEFFFTGVKSSQSWFFGGGGNLRTQTSTLKSKSEIGGGVTYWHKLQLWNPNLKWGGELTDTNFNSEIQIWNWGGGGGGEGG